MKKAVLHTDKYFGSTDIDKRVYGSFAEHMGRLVYSGIYQPGHPTADEDGFRQDVIDLVKEQGVTTVRYPGGNFVSAYRWEDTVGPREQRPVCTEPAWKSLESNQFGLNEFMTWCKKTGIEPMMAINLGTRGADAARGVLEYCNFNVGKYAEMRKSHGYADPHNVKMWCLGNEMDGVWQIGHRSADEYGSIAVQTGRLMKRLDPTLELIACGSAGVVVPTFCAWDATVMEHCYDTADYISVHTYFDNRNKNEQDSANFIAASNALDNQIKSVIATMDYVRAKLRKKTYVNLSVDEWNVVYRPHGKVPPQVWTHAPHEIEDVYNLEDALLVASLMMTMLRHADRVKIACQAQLVNVISPIMTSDDSAWRQTIYYPFADMSRYARGRVLPMAVECDKYEAGIYGDANYIDALLTETPEDDTLALFVVNRELHDSTEITLDLRQYEGYKVVSHSVLNSEGLRDTNTEAEPNKVAPHAGNAKIEDGILNAVLENHSYNCIVLKKA